MLFGQKLGMFNSNCSYLNPHLSCTVCKYAGLPMNAGLIWTSFSSLSCVQRSNTDRIGVMVLKDGRSRIVHSEHTCQPNLNAGVAPRYCWRRIAPDGCTVSCTRPSECALSKAIKKLICDGGEHAILGLKREKKKEGEDHIMRPSCDHRF